MAQGKFSQPRPHRDEERQIEQAFRQVTGREPVPQPQSPLYNEEAQIEETIRQVKEQQPAAVPPKRPVSTAPRRPAAAPKQEAFDLLPEDVDTFFEGDPSAFQEESYEAEPDFVDNMAAFLSKAMDYCSKNRKVVMVGLCAIALVLIVAFIAIFFASNSDPYDSRILENVLIADIDVGGMTKNEAISTVKLATSNTYASKDMVIDLSGTELRLSPKDTDAELDAKAAVNAAYDYGRTGTKSEREQALTLSHTQQHIIGVLPYLELDTDYIKEVLTTYAEDSGSTLTQPIYGLEGDEPELSADKFDENAPCQTLVITMGTPGVGFDVEEVYDQVLDAYSLHLFLVEVENVESVKEPDPVDLEAIYEEFYIEPVNATVNLQNFKTEPGSYGYGFDLEAAQKLIDNAQYGEEVRIPMEYIAPDILDDDSFFQDILGEAQTRHTSNANRNTNLRLACEAIDGTMLDPGDTFSFNEVVGKRTAAKGYKTAPSDTGPNAEDTLAGGINQVSSTLYYAALLSDLNIVSRTNGKYVPSFIDYGMDAIVDWNASDLEFRNNLGYPIQISAEVSGGYVKIQILGTEERSHYVMMEYDITKTTEPDIEYKYFDFDNDEGYEDGDVIQAGATGYQVKTYKVKYDMETNKKLSRDFVAHSTYDVVGRVIARVEPEETTVPTEETEPEETTPPTTEATKPTEPETEPTTQPTETTAPPETTQATEPPETTVATQPPETTSPPETTTATQPTTPAATPSADSQNQSAVSEDGTGEAVPSEA